LVGEKKTIVSTKKKSDKERLLFYRNKKNLALRNYL